MTGGGPICSECATHLVSEAPLPAPLTFAVHLGVGVEVKGVPGGECPRCGKARHSRSGLDLARMVAGRIRTDMNRAAPGLHASGEVRYVSIDLTAKAPVPTATAGASFLTPVCHSVANLDELVLAPEIRKGVRRFITSIDPRVRKLVGKQYTRLATRRFLNLWGPPGSGKTLLATVIARHLDKPLLALELGQVSSKWVGDTEKQLTAAFSAVRQQGAVLFIDEADALLARRSAGRDSQGTSRDAILNHVIALLNGHEGVVVFATNRLEAYDLAIDRRLTNLHVPAPTGSVRRELWLRLLTDAAVVPATDAAWVKELDALVDSSSASRDPERPFTASDIETVVFGAAVETCIGDDSEPRSVPRRAVRAMLLEHLADMERAMRRRGSPTHLTDVAAAVLNTFVQEDVALAKALSGLLAEAAPLETKGPNDRAKAARLKQKAVELAVKQLAARQRRFENSGVTRVISEETLRNLARSLPEAGAASA